MSRFSPGAPWSRWLLLIVLGGFFNRLALIPFGGFTGDLERMRVWEVRLATVPLADFYASGGLLDHLPGDLWVHWLLVHAFQVLEPGAQLAEHPLYLRKLVACFADVGVGLMLFLLGRQLGRPGSGLLAAGLYLFNPASLFLSAIWGQWDAVSALVMLLAFWLLLRGTGEWSFPALTYAVLIKPTYALLAPFFALEFVRRHMLPSLGPGSQTPGTRSAQSVRCLALRSLIAVGGSALLFYAVVLPFDVGLWPVNARWSILERIQIAYTEYPLATLNAFNLWALLDAQLRRDDLRSLGLTYETWGKILLMSVYGVVLIVAWRRPGERTLLWASLVTTFGLFMLPTRQHERYLFPTVVFGAVAAAVAPRFCWWYVALSLSYLFNLSWVFDKYFQSFGLESRSHFASVVRLASLFNLALFLYVLTRGLADLNEPTEEAGPAAGARAAPAWESPASSL